jgi:hypothetical protein
MVQLLRSMQLAAASEIVIDSSKSPAHGYMLGQLPNVELLVLHLVRDARGAQYSLLKRKQKDDPRLRHFSPLWGSVKWLWTNLVTALIFSPRQYRYLRIKYEDFAAEPHTTVERIFRWVGQAPNLPPSLAGREIDLAVTHSVGGSAHRFITGRTRIEPDTEWKTHLTASQRVQIAFGAGLGLLWYGYWPAVQ